QRSDLILTGGGLGPTDDDVTRESIAAFLGEKMTIDPTLEKELRARFTRMGTGMPQTNLRQATLIPSAKPIRNSMGTAPGWWVEKDGHILIAMPGPSVEMQEMWRQEIQPKLQQNSGAIILSRTLKLFDQSEAAVGEVVAEMMASANPTLGIYAKADGIHLRLTAKAEERKQAEKMLADGEARIRAMLGKHIWGTDSDTPETVVGRLLTKKRQSLAIMEDCSGGQLASTIVNAPESQTFFKGGLVACSDEAKILSGVDARLISQYGPVSPEVAKAMAEAVRKFLKADIGLSTTGVKESDGRAAGTLYIGIASDKGSQAINRARRRHINTAALLELRKSLIAPGTDK
ncbi:MAG: nicotinamide-nucleotide amidohydrolase family protein, partial [Chloroflexi bacterium]|nr:nicotinamide-nucleotide amidohydrolase family protein [Chloroflexota bacterium]